MVYVFKTPSPKAGRSVRFASSPVKSNVRLLGPTNLKSTVGQYSCTDHTNTVMVARLEPPVQGSTVERNYSSDHWANLRTAVNNLSLTAINFPLLTDSPAANLNSPLKNRSFPKSTMKNAIPPTLAPRISRSARKAEDRDAFDDNVDVRAPIGANPVPPDTPTYPGLYHGALAFGSPRGSKHQRVHRFPSPNTTPDDDQDQPIKKKRRTSIKKGPQAAYHANNSDDNFDQIIQEDRNLHFHERNNKIAAPSTQGTNISHRATTPTKMAAKMQATSPTTPTTTSITTDDNKKGTNTEPDDQTTKNYASTNVAYKDIGPTDDNYEDRTTITTTTNSNNSTSFNMLDHPHSTTDIADANAAIQTPPKELTSPPTATSKRRHRARRFYPRRRPRTSRPQIDPYDDPTSLQYLSQDVLDLIDAAFSNSSFRLVLRPDNEGDSRPSSLVRTDQHAPNSDHHLPHYHSNLKMDIIDMARYVCTIHTFTEDEEPIKASYSLGTIQDDVDEIIRATGNMYLMSVQNTLTMIAHALVRHTTRCQAPQYSLLSNIPKFERIRSDRSRETTVQSSKSHFGTLVGTDNSADSRLKTMTSDENRDNGSATQQFCTDFSPIDPEIPDSPKTPTATSPTFYELYPEYSPCSFGIRSRTNSQRQLNNPRFRFKIFHVKSDS
ncbi:hypothetical protein MHU86_406 [Fragilaria crotonensis]|nr:hypothetical protein MHU86_406 [Fragilaria crotonensis]